VRVVAADGDVLLGPGCVIEEWLDVEGAVDAGARCQLGRQASAAGRFRLGPECSFRRLWGFPVTTAAAADDPTAERVDSATADGDGMTLDDAVLWTGRRLTMPAHFTLDRDLVVHGEVRVSSGNRVRGSIKAYGELHLGRGVEVDGSLICRRDIRIDGQARIRGNVFAEGDIVIGPGTTIGQEGGVKSVYARGRVKLATDVRVFGWIVADGTGGGSAS
jgi:cytoskeletal protein CcmA (bactofilin family)